MKLKNLGLVAASGLFAFTLAGCSAAHAVTVPAITEAAVEQAQDEGPAVEQATADQQADQQTDQQATVDEQADQQAAEEEAVPEVSPEEEAANPAALQVVDSGWFASNGMIDFAVEVTNPNHTVEATDAVIEVVGKDDAGNVLFDETIETPGILPDSTYYYTYVAGSTANSSADSNEVVTPTTVEFSISAPEGSWATTDQKLADVYTVQDNGAADTQFGAKEFTGTVTASEALGGATQSRVDVVLLDADGNIEGGYFKIVDTTPGQATDYDIYAVGAPEFASYAVYASPWTTDAE